MRLCDGMVNGVYHMAGTHLSVQLSRRLEALGLTQGAKITIMNKKRHGALVMKVRGTRFAIGKSISENIDVEAEVGSR